jgi:hypothetical protein
LEDELLAVGGEVGFGVLAAEGQLLEIAQVLFVRESELIVLCRAGSWSQDKKQQRPGE